MWYSNLGYLDLVLVLALIAGGISGYRSGVVIELSSIIAIGFSIFFYTHFYSSLTKLIKPFVDNKQMLPYLSAASLFFLTSFASIIISKIIRFIIRMTPMGIIDRGMGALIGSLKWLFYASILVWMLGMANKKLNKRYIKNSVSNKILHAIMPKIFNKITEMPKPKSKFRNYKNQKPAKQPKKERKVNPDLDI
ncbi:MAG: CvpA family protein [Bacteroidetes bacterium]|nr:CvpA family protein [Bacteroidota bacterium]